MYPFCRARKGIGEGGKRGRVPWMSHMIPLVPWEVMIKCKHKAYFFPWVSVRPIFMNAVSLQNVTQHDEVMLRRKTWLRLFFMSLSYAPVSICCGSHGNTFLRSLRETTLRTRLTDCPSCHFWIHHCFRAVFLGCSQPVTSTVWVLLHTFSAQHSMLCSFCLESFTELHCCLRLFPLYPAILFLLCASSFLLLIVPGSNVGEKGSILHQPNADISLLIHFLSEFVAIVLKNHWIFSNCQWMKTLKLFCIIKIDFAAAAKSLQSCPTLCDPIDGLLPGSSVPGILQARTLEWVAISFSNAWKWKVKVKSLSRVRLIATSWTAAYQAPPSMGFSRRENWNGVPLPSPKIDFKH